MSEGGQRERESEKFQSALQHGSRASRGSRHYDLAGTERMMVHDRLLFASSSSSKSFNRPPTNTITHMAHEDTDAPVPVTFTSTESN